jgi:hypothetical protein
MTSAFPNADTSTEKVGMKGGVRKKIETLRAKRGYLHKDKTPQEWEIIIKFCGLHPEAVCVGGCCFMGCRPKGSKNKDFIHYNIENGKYIRSNGVEVEIDETYCKRKIPKRVSRWEKALYENQIWSRDRIGRPDLIDGKLIIEAKSGLPTIQKFHSVLGQLLFYQETDSRFELGFIYPKAWHDREDIEVCFDVLKRYGIKLIPIE